MTLTDAQWAAVRRTGQDVCAVAGPGSGKTRVLIERFAWLVQEARVPASRILAITFTEKAALEIKQRLIVRFQEIPDLRHQIEHAWVSTIHGFCARLLRENAIAAGLDPEFAVLDQGRADRLERESAEEVLDAMFQETPQPMRRLLEALDLSTQEDGRNPDLARSLLEVYGTLRASGLQELPSPNLDSSVRGRTTELARWILSDSEMGNTANQRLAHKSLRHWAREFGGLPLSPITLHHFSAVKFSVHLGHFVKGSTAREAASELKNDLLPRLEAQFLGAFYSDIVDMLRLAISRIDATYAEKKRRASVLDFDDLEQKTIQLLESNDALRVEISRRFDHILMDELQDTNRLQWRLVNLLRRHFFAVGDVNQSIYGFRYADPSVFDEYRQGLTAAGAAIDTLAENHRSRPEILAAVARILDGEPGIEPRPLIAAGNFPGTSGPIIERLVARGDTATEVEASMVAGRIRDLERSGQYKLGDIAVLVRTLASTEPFERAFDRLGIRFVVSGGRTFLEARETRDLLALMATLVNPLDDIALVGVLRSPLVGMGDEEIFRIGKQGWIQEFDKRFGPLRRLAGFVAPDRLLATALDESGYCADLSDRARANIEKLFGYIRREHRDRPRPLAELLEDLESLRETQSEAEAPPPESGDLVRLMTIHAAKGLEFPVVFLSALHRGTDRRRPVITFAPSAGLGVKWRNPVTKKGQSDEAHLVAVNELKEKEQAEENRLLYVAMTRAKDRLIFSYVEGKRPSGWQKLVEPAVPVMTAAERIPEQLVSLQEAASAVPAEKLLNSPSVKAQHDSSASVTAVAAFHACPRRYYLGHYLGMEGKSQSRDDLLVTGPRAADLGLEVHRMLAGEFRGSAEAAQLAQSFASSELGERAARASRREREYDFMLSIEDVVLRGQIDLWFEEAGELVLVDYKTDREEVAKENYQLQIRLYALALERYAGRLPDRAVLFYLRSDRPIGVSLEPGELDQARGTVKAFLAAQHSLAFPLNMGAQCRRCPFLGNRCPADLSL